MEASTLLDLNMTTQQTAHPKTNSTDLSTTAPPMIITEAGALLVADHLAPSDSNPHRAALNHHHPHHATTINHSTIPKIVTKYPKRNAIAINL